MNKKALIFLMVILMVSCSPQIARTPVALTPVNVCYSAIAGTQAVTWYAYEKGLFEKYGLQVNLVSISGGSKAATTLVSGDMDICQVAAPSVVNAVAAKQDLVIIAGLINTVPGSLMTQPEIKNVDMLRGKIIGIDQGSSTEAITRLALQSLNIDPDHDVVLLNIGGEPERAAALEARKIDATVIIPPLTVEMRNKGYVDVFNIGAAKIPYQGTAIATTRHFLAKNRLVVTDFMKAILEAIIRMKEDPDGTKAIIAKYMSLDPIKDAASLKETYDTIVTGTLEDIPYPTLEGLQVVIDIAAPGNPDVAAINPADVVDVSILDDLKTSGFISSLK